MIKEIHGVVGAKEEHAFSDDERSLRFIDRDTYICATLGGASYGVKLTAEEARLVSKQLLHAAIRLEQRTKK